MPRTAALHRTPWSDIAEAQRGIVSRNQLLGLRLTPTQVKADLAANRWQRILPGVYATFTGPVDTVGKLWAAVLYAGEGSVIAGRAALWLWSVVDDVPGFVSVAVPESRRVRAQPGLRIQRRRGLNVIPASSTVLPTTDSDSVLRHPSARPPRLRLEEALLDMPDVSSASGAVDLVLRATQRRLTTAAHLRRSIELRNRLRWRAVLLEALAAVQDGVTSPLEARYRRDVERRHRLPNGARNEPEFQPAGYRRYRDVRYRAWRVLVELDGREAHPPEGAFRDLRRDNSAAVAGDTTLRYGWRDVVGNPCVVAAQVAAVLRLGGWTGRPRPCSATCDAGRDR